MPLLKPGQADRSVPMDIGRCLPEAGNAFALQRRDELGIRRLVRVEQVIPNRRAALGVDHLQRPGRVTICNPVDLTSTVSPSRVTLPQSGECSISGSAPVICTPSPTWL